MSWEFLYSLNVLTYPNLVRKFYENLKFGHGVIETKVKGIQIMLDAVYLARALKIRTERSKEDKLE